jgi:hypothetical protein
LSRALVTFTWRVVSRPFRKGGLVRSNSILLNRRVREMLGPCGYTPSCGSEFGEWSDGVTFSSAILKEEGLSVRKATTNFPPLNLLK